MNKTPKKDWRLARVARQARAQSGDVGYNAGMIHSTITANFAKHANANEVRSEKLKVRGRERRTRFLLLTSLFSLLALSGCGTLSLTSDAI
ncbi:MAG: hypothetical protein LBD14_00490, partial [Puniceicoccales bacterium]|nr:hypothetical protein [Puniceicoccales bacterium]